MVILTVKKVINHHDRSIKLYFDIIIDTFITEPFFFLNKFKKKREKNPS